MLIEEETKDEPKIGDINPDALEAVLVDEGDAIIEDEGSPVFKIRIDDDDANELDIAFYDDEDNW